MNTSFEDCLETWAGAFILKLDDSEAWTALKDARLLLSKGDPRHVLVMQADRRSGNKPAQAALLALARLPTRQIVSRVGLEPVLSLSDSDTLECRVLKLVSKKAHRRVHSWVYRNHRRPIIIAREQARHRARKMEERARKMQELREGLWGDFYTLAQEAGDKTTEDFCSDWSDGEPSFQTADFLNSDGHCVHCCNQTERENEEAEVKSACEGCCGRLTSESVGGSHGYYGMLSDQSEEWVLSCDFCGGCQEYDIPELACARIETQNSIEDRPYAARCAVDEKLDALIARCSSAAAQILLGSAKQDWEDGEGFKSETLLFAALLEGAPQAQLNLVLQGHASSAWEFLLEKSKALVENGYSEP